MTVDQKRKRVLLLGMLDSVHLGRWLQLQNDNRLEIVLFPAGINRRIHPEVKKCLGASLGPRIQIVNHHRFISLVVTPIAKILRLDMRAVFLDRLIKSQRPDVVHVVEIQNAGYLYLQSSMRRQKFWQLFVSNYGSDIYWFARNRAHRKRINELMSEADFYSYECERDKALGIENGFSGQKILLAPNSGGIPSSKIVDNLTNERNGIVVKGYQGWSGMAHSAIWALYGIRKQLRDKPIKVFSANMSTAVFCYIIRLASGLKIKSFRKHSLTHDQVLEIFRSSEIYLGVSKTDGISTAVLESMSQGCIPVQSDTSCAAEWFLPGETGIAIPDNDTSSISQAVIAGMKLAEVREARLKNIEIIRSRYASEVLAATLSNYYFIDAG